MTRASAQIFTLPAKHKGVRVGYCNFNLSEIGRRFHDEEWGVPVHDDRKLFEFLVMTVMQCGFTWEMILRKREVFRLGFDGFDFDKIAAYTDQDVERVLATPGMIHSLSKVRAIIGNAQVVRRIRAEHGSFDAFLWNYADGRTIVYNGHPNGDIPAGNGLSARMARDLRRRGMKYLGLASMYLFLQTCGIVNDHGEDCPRFHFINSSYPVVRKKRDHEGAMQSTAADVRAQAAMPPKKSKVPKAVAEPMWEFRTPEMIFGRRCAVPRLLESFGFQLDGRTFRYETPLVDEMFTLFVNVDEEGSVTTRLVDRMSGDEYVHHLVSDAVGAFVGRVRREFDDVLDRINAACFADKALA